MRPRRPPRQTHPPRRPGRRPFPRPVQGARSRPSLPSRLLPPSRHPSLIVLVESQSRVDRPLAREGVGLALGLAQSLAIYFSRQVPDELPLHNSAHDCGDLILGVGVEVEAYYLALLPVADVLEGLRQL